MFKFQLAALLAAFGVIGAAAGTIVCEKNDFPGHLQGIAADSSGIYWSFYDTVIKTDYTGRIIASVKAPRHTGDPCLAEGKLYVPIILYDRKDIKREGGTGWVYVYDTNLKFLSKTPVPEAPRPGSMTFHDGKFYISGDDFGKEPHPVNPINIYDRDLKFERRVIVDIGTPTRYGARRLLRQSAGKFPAFIARSQGRKTVPDLAERGVRVRAAGTFRRAEAGPHRPQHRQAGSLRRETVDPRVARRPTRRRRTRQALKDIQSALTAAAMRFQSQRRSTRGSAQ